MMATKDRLGGKKTLKVELLDEIEKDAIKKQIDIVALFAHFGVELKPVGRGFKGLCPFHDDHTPSLSVDREKGMYNCFACGESGDVVTLVMVKMNSGFREAMEFLKNFNGNGSAISKTIPESKPAPKAEPKIEPIVASTEVIASISLDDVASEYRKNLESSTSAQEYLKTRGLFDPELVARFGIGFCRGNLAEKLSDAQKKLLVGRGMLNADGSERFAGFLMVPLYDDHGRVVEFYGRRLSNVKPMHLYPEGTHCGLMNRGAAKAYRDELILTESVIDALSLIKVGIENVIPCFGANGFTPMHERLLRDERVKTVVVAFDSDATGVAASAKLRDKLVAAGFNVKIISPTNGKDWNEELVAGSLSKESVRNLIDGVPIKEPKREEEKPFTVKAQGNRYAFTFKDVTYKLEGVKECSVASLRVGIRAETDVARHTDTADLYSGRSRSTYAMACGMKLNKEIARIENDLEAMLDHLIDERERAFRVADNEAHELTEEECRLGMELLTSPDLFTRILSDMETLGYVGEDRNKLLVYLAASSRILDDPISVMILSQSASGKSLLVDTVRKLIPEEDVLALTSLSDQALNYIESLMHKFLIMGEAVHSEVIEHQVREMLSNKELARLVATRDEKTGETTSRLVKTPVVVSCIMSSTSSTVNPENASRFFLVNADESQEQTKRIHEKQREKYTLERHLAKTTVIPRIVTMHHAAQRLLAKRVIVNRFARHLDFPVTLMRVRRDHDRFLDLIAVVCFMRQMQKPLLHFDDGTAYLECDIEDYSVAYDLMVNGVLASTMVELPKSAQELHAALRSLAKKQAEGLGIEPHEVSFTQRDIREKTEFGQSWIKQNLRSLVEYEYVTVTRGGRERSKGIYRLRADEPLHELNLAMIPTPDRMRAILETGQNRP